MTTSRTNARAGLPIDDPKNFLTPLKADVAPVVFTVRVAVCADAPEIVTDWERLHVAGSLAAVGVIAQVRFTVPVNPPDGVRVIVDVLPEVAPGATVTAVPEIVKLGDGRIMV